MQKKLKYIEIIWINNVGGIVFSGTFLITIPALVIYVIISSSKKQLAKENEYNNLYKEKLILPLLQEVFKDM